MSGAATVSLTVNGQAHSVTAEARTTLADLLRDDLGLTGTNLGCEHGVCGSCTVLADGEAVRSCLVLAVQCDGVEIRTVEGLAPDGADLTPLQQAFHEEHGLQCGFCTPGFLMLATGALEKGQPLDEDDELLDELLASNLCRCTGYVGIRRAVVRAAREARDR
jgi:carbon-monoxide dehydrogenase small subunit